MAPVWLDAQKPGLDEPRQVLAGRGWGDPCPLGQLAGQARRAVEQGQENGGAARVADRRGHFGQAVRGDHG
jgi:hypothetical protein